jgi:hypothetical protein
VRSPSLKLEDYKELLHDEKKKVFCITLLALIISLCSCSKDGSIKTGNYYLPDNDSADKSPCVEIVDGDTIVFNDIDAMSIIDAEIEGFIQADASFTQKDAQTGEEKTVVFKDATPEEMAKYKEYQMKRFEGERNYRVEMSGDVHVLFFDKDTLPFGEYVPQSNTIKIGGKSYVLEE